MLRLILAAMVIAALFVMSPARHGPPAALGPELEGALASAQAAAALAGKAPALLGGLQPSPPHRDESVRIGMPGR